MSGFVYAPGASAEFQKTFGDRVTWWGNQLRAAAPGCLAVVLGGGYGRGDGGVTVDRDGREHPYNDLDLFGVFEDRRVVASRLVQQALETLRAEAARDLGVAVDLGRPLTPTDLDRLPAQLMWVDLAGGHRVLAGDPNLVAQKLARLAGTAPVPSEAARLLLNRGVGLLFCQFVLEGHPLPVNEPVDSGFVARNLHKAYLAVLDAFLILEGRYTARCAGKLAALGPATALPEPVARLTDRFASAIAFKHRPDRSDLSGTWEEWERALTEVGEAFLALETRRLGVRAESPLAYAADGRLREPDLHNWPASPFHWVRNLRLGLGATAQGLRYPREPLYRALALRLSRVPGPHWPTGLGPWADDGVFFRSWARYN